MKKKLHMPRTAGIRLCVFFLQTTLKWPRNSVRYLYLFGGIYFSSSVPRTFWSAPNSSPHPISPRHTPPHTTMRLHNPPHELLHPYRVWLVFALRNLFNMYDWFYSKNKPHTIMPTRKILSVTDWQMSTVTCYTNTYSLLHEICIDSTDLFS